ncbi:hypothetical protein SMACR_08530 [Sordaria macrospora]|uniref:WGS project CABT00000000 data, contig 2.59 n=2 Tax=Sordaria macrospora TaxID=5147 RepID=F7WA84_SORMK|nr:uncharacterized protein SMAC_08530 [Sordaria macrospora k-hell]KAA8627948.1 hypothetical protein SMACR_08530 [Sordaria macrospora]WPJ64278.1 hypothetical protein SMAC4_08530 [Sordaria macrospora]CCC05278.1 unnamed protein product [Sordaria macrospora k-hell]
MPAHRVYIETRAVDRSPRNPNPRSPPSPRHRPRTRSEERIYVYRDNLSTENITNTMTDHDRVLREAYDEAYRQNQTLRNKLAERDHKLAEKDLDLAEKDGRINQLQAQNLNLRQTLDSLSDVEGRQDDLIHDLKRKTSKLRKDKDDLKAENRELRHESEGKMRHMADQINALKQEMANWRLQCESEKRKNIDLERRCGRLRENLDLHRGQSETFRTQSESLRAENDQLREIIDLAQPLRVFRH